MQNKCDRRSTAIKRRTLNEVPQRRTTTVTITAAALAGGARARLTLDIWHLAFHEYFVRSSHHQSDDRISQSVLGGGSFFAILI